MSIFDNTRLGAETFKLDVERMRRGWYSDKYFANIVTLLSGLARDGYTFGGHHARPVGDDVDLAQIHTGDLEVEMQWFTRRQPVLRHRRRGQGPGHAQGMHRLL